MIRATVVAAVLAGAVLAMPSTAHAAGKGDPYTENSPGCISHREWQNFERGTMRQVEDRNDVRGVGRYVIYQDQGDHVVKAYPWCGHPANDTIQVSYDRNVRGQYMANYVTEFDLP